MEAQLKLVLFFLAVNSVLSQQVRLSSESEWSALLDLRSSLGIRAKDWPKKSDPCSNWTGIECRNGRVIGMNLSGLRRTRLGRLNPQFSVDSLANLTLLASFNSSGFLLPGSIPNWFGQSLMALQVLDLRSCSIVGPIPSSFGTMGRLNSLYLSNNSLTGTIPSTLGNFSSVAVVDLSQNLLTGSIPNTFSDLNNLTTLDLSSNFLSGPIPSGFGSLRSLQFLNLYNNSLDASIPVQLGNLSQLIELNLGSNSLSGSLPGNLGGMRSLQKLLIGNNDLEGPLPEALWKMQQLRFLDVSDNNFTGVFRNLTAAFNASGEVFNFSNNQFYGSLVSVVGKFGSIYLSGNYFQGVAPNDIGINITVAINCFQSVPNQRSFEECRRFYADRGLSFRDESAPDAMQPPLPEPSKSKKRLTYVLVGIFGGLGFIVILVLVLALLLKTCQNRNANQRGSANLGPVPQGVSTTPPKDSISLSGLGESFTFIQMLAATDEFSDTNLIKHGHSGDLFRGTLEGGLPVVIKKVDLRSFRKESYILELDVFSKATHTRLVPLLGHCLEQEDEKLLVYKYMPNGDLSSSLYRFTNLEDDSPHSLDWITRLKIAIGAAEGLCYLHHDCNPPLVHRDIQASSILLDDKYEVRLGSLSEIRAHGVDNHQNVVSGLLRRLQTTKQGWSGSGKCNSLLYVVYSCKFVIG
ncbi:unnamed protein product [Ilex paraguariensis]|uniref:Protein kinase domain-containing protein n=1 Tax=Ilex paraguariensis TaxID=185542 RepID=A0ABC8SY24_9AQUA